MNLEAALDSLYAAPPEEFLATRKKLAKEVNPTIGSRRKPTTAAYVLNQLARRHAKDVESLVDVGRELARAQRRGEGLREAIEKQRSTVELVTKDAALVMRQALAGLLWGKQYYEYDVHRWLRERGLSPWSAEAASVRNGTWFHLQASDIISMPDKWEYPWFAAWDLAFHCAPLGLVDVDFAKEQVELLLHTRYVHPNGQVPAYEWNFSDVNPPVTAWAALWVYQREVELRGAGDRVWLGRVFQRLLTNFTWWVNRKDPDGRNLFQGGFLGLDNIGVFDRSNALPGGGTLRQADATAWMALYCQWMLQIAVELGREDQSYADIALKLMMQVRNKIIDAYQEVMKMQV